MKLRNRKSYPHRQKAVKLSDVPSATEKLPAAATTDLCENDLCENDPLALLLNLPPAPEAEVPVLPRGNKKKFTLVLDLDETLVHCSTFECRKDSIPIVVHIPGKGPTTIYVNQRPHLQTFLTHVSRDWELVVFTASFRAYADRVLDLIDPAKCIQHRLYRDCCYITNGKFIKNLKILGRDLGRTVLVDNSIEAFWFQMDNGLLIDTWVADEEDEKLLELSKLLDQIIDNDPADVTKFLRAQEPMMARHLQPISFSHYNQSKGM